MTRWFRYCFRCQVCGWETGRTEPYSRVPRCTVCKKVTPMDTYAVHQKCRKWHPEGTPCPTGSAH